MTRRKYTADGVLDMITNDSNINDQEDGDFHDTDLEIRDDENDGNSDSMNIDDVDVETDSGADTNGRSEWLPSDNDLSRCPFTVQNFGATLQF